MRSRSRATWRFARLRSKSRRTKCAASTPRGQLAEAESVAQQRLRKVSARRRRHADRAGDSVSLRRHTFGKDVVVEPYVVFGEKVTVEDGAVIHSFSHIVGAHIGKGVSVGPFARLRPGTQLGDGSRIGNFVRSKKR